MVIDRPRRLVRAYDVKSASCRKNPLVPGNAKIALMILPRDLHDLQDCLDDRLRAIELDGVAAAF
jgi:hypothetical protein